MDELRGKTCSYFYPRPTLVSLSVKKHCLEVIQHKNRCIIESIGVEWFVGLDFGNEKRTTPYIIQNKENTSHSL